MADEGDEVGEDLDGVPRERAFLQMLVGGPDFGGGDVVRRPGDGFGECFELLVNEVPFRVGLVVEDLEGGDFVLVVVEELFPVGDEALGFFFVVVGGDEFVAGEVVDGDLAVAAFAFEEVAEGGVGGDGSGSFFCESSCCVSLQFFHGSEGGRGILPLIL